jgi:hypothetical protein
VTELFEEEVKEVFNTIAYQILKKKINKLLKDSYLAGLNTGYKTGYTALLEQIRIVAEVREAQQKYVCVYTVRRVK